MGPKELTELFPSLISSKHFLPVDALKDIFRGIFFRG